MLALRIFGIAMVCSLLASRTLARDQEAEASENWPQWRGPLGDRRSAARRSAAASGTKPTGQTSAGRRKSRAAAIPRRSSGAIASFSPPPFRLASRLPPRPSTAPGNHDNLPVTHRHKFVALAVSRTSGKILWQQTLREALPHGAGAPDRQPGVELSGDRRRAPVRLLWLVRAVLPRARRQAGLESRLWPDAIAAWARRGKLAGALQRHAHRQLGPRGKFVPRGARQAHRQRAVESRAERSHLLGHADHHRACGQAPGDRQRHQPRPRLRSGQRQGAVGMRRAIVEHRRLAGVRATAWSSPAAATTSGPCWRFASTAPAGTLPAPTGSPGAAFAARPTFPRPLLYDGGLYFLTHYQGILSRVDARTGEDRPGSFRLDGIENIYSSPVAAAGRIYVTDLDGTTIVVSSGELPRLLSLNHLVRTDQRLGRHCRPTALPPRREASLLSGGKRELALNRPRPTRKNARSGRPERLHRIVMAASRVS